MSGMPTLPVFGVLKIVFGCHWPEPAFYLRLANQVRAGCYPSAGGFILFHPWGGLTEARLLWYWSGWLNAEDAVVEPPAGSAAGLQLLDSLQVLLSCCLLWLAVQRDYQVDRAPLINTLFAGNLCILSVLGIRFYCCDTSLTLLLFWQQQNNVLLLISWAACYLWLRFYSIDFEAVIFVFYNQENLIQCTEPDSVQVSTKDMDSTLSKASRAIKKTSKKVIMRPFSISCPRMELWLPLTKQKWAMES